MAVPRLADERCFLKLDPDDLEDYDAATTVSGSSTHGEQVGPSAIDRVDLIVSGSVAVTPEAAGSERERATATSSTPSSGNSVSSTTRRPSRPPSTSDN